MSDSENIIENAGSLPRYRLQVGKAVAYSTGVSSLFRNPRCNSVPRRNNRKITNDADQMVGSATFLASVSGMSTTFANTRIDIANQA
jgi:hypothetical protein